MAYTALYRKWRPAVFDDVKGQDHIVQTLKNQIISDRIGHAYLFCGTRGTGKTTVAKIFAKAVNCESPVNGSPCGHCASCMSISSGASLNVVEIDAASNNGVENIRDIREQVLYPPSEGRYRVYIIDEVHMLSTGAFNALLKTLEEPPSYVIFILATTEPQKIPVTVLSRCQRYDFKRISVPTITDRLKELAVSEDIDVEEKALTYIARAADGSMRDALSLLDQCVAFHFGERLTYDDVLDILGAVDNSIFSSLFRSVTAGETDRCMRELEDIVNSGRDMGQFVTDFMWYLRNLLLVSSTEDAEDLLDMSSENVKQLKEDARLADPETLARYIRIFSELSNQIRYSDQKRILVELAFIKLSKPEMEPSYDAVIERLNRVEEELSKIISARIPEGVPDDAPDRSSVNDAADDTVSEHSDEARIISETSEDQISEDQMDDYTLISSKWQSILQGLGGAVRSSFRNSTVEPGIDGCIDIVFTEPDLYEIGKRPVLLETLEHYVRDNFGRDIIFRAKMAGDKHEQASAFVTEEEIQKRIHMKVDIED